MVIHYLYHISISTRDQVDHTDAYKAFNQNKIFSADPWRGSAEELVEEPWAEPLVWMMEAEAADLRDHPRRVAREDLAEAQQR